MDDLNAFDLPHLFSELTRDGSLDRLLALARDEDLGERGDVTTASLETGDGTIAARLVAREAGVVAGMAVLPHVAAAFGPAARWRIERADGSDCAAGDVLARVEGPLADVLATERTLLNVVSRLSAIATRTRRYAEAVVGTGAVVCDTRKTTPGWRGIEKYAVRCGGGTLHRVGLFDAALYKDNHLAVLPRGDGFGPALAAAIGRARAAGPLRFVEVEVDTLDQLDVVLGLERGLVDLVLLDNMSTDDLRTAVARRDEHATHVGLEASGGVTLDTVRAIAETGVDRISVGALTHGAGSLDVGLDTDARGRTFASR